MAREFVAGTISSAGWGNGSRCAIGAWSDTPIGPFGDVMWVQPDGTRVLYAPSDEIAAYIESIYAFDDIRIGTLDIRSDGQRTTVDGEELRIELTGGRRRPIPIPRPRAVTRFIEAPIARRLMGVETYGVSPTGVQEWYQTRGWRWVVDGTTYRDGVDLGPPTPIQQPLRVGFSEPPTRPSIVSVTVHIER